MMRQKAQCAWGTADPLFFRSRSIHRHLPLSHHAINTLPFRSLSLPPPPPPLHPRAPVPPLYPRAAKLKMVYCAVPKVACNSWLMWLRARLGLPHPEDPLLALDEERSGLKELAIHFTEEEAVRRSAHCAGCYLECGYLDQRKRQAMGFS